MSWSPHEPSPEAALSGLAAALRAAHSVAVLTGAGVSAESGLATFRDPDTGLWTGVDIEAVASAAGFRRDPLRLWRWTAARRRAMDAAAPNAGHHALAAMERRLADFTLITQNIDGLHGRAGSRNLVELHGNIRRARCSLGCPGELDWAPDADLPPPCPRCAGPLRPGVVWFGEALPRAALAQAEAAALRADLFLSVGTSGLVEPAASLPFLARRAGALVVEVNPAATPFTEFADQVLAAGAAIALPALLAAAWPEAGAAPAGDRPGR